MTNKCPSCHQQTKPRSIGGNQGIYCEFCNKWIVVTTNFPDIALDKTIYTVFLDKIDDRNVDALRDARDATGLNYVKLRKRIRDLPIKLFDGDAISTMYFVEKLKNSSIKYHIEPEYKWKHSDACGIKFARQ